MCSVYVTFYVDLDTKFVGLWWSQSAVKDSVTQP